ncbi:MAG: cytochrome c3 family protein [Candidatus Marinimicrobia bacterium]|nr:cytochrome c3 family protein [Candidatus Neomarinimicrobiota bacterium]
MNKNIITAIVIGIIIISGLSLFGLSRGPKPIIQPIPFSHEKHVEELDLECSSCHTQVTKHPRATLPSIKICYECHSEPMTKT